MNVGKTLFAQGMEFVPWKTFGRIIERTRAMSVCARSVAPTCFASWPFLNSPGVSRCVVSKYVLKPAIPSCFTWASPRCRPVSTLADALNLRDWRIFHALALPLISHARARYAQDPSVLGLDASVYAPDSTTIDLCLSLFDWAPFRSTKAAFKLHNLLDPRGAIPAFIHISDGKLHDVNVLDILLVEAGSFYIMDRGYLDFVRLYAIDQAGAFFVTRAKQNMNARRVYSRPVDRASGILCDQRVMPNGFYSAENYPDHRAAFASTTPKPARRWCF